MEVNLLVGNMVLHLVQGLLICLGASLILFSIKATRYLLGHRLYWGTWAVTLVFTTFFVGSAHQPKLAIMTQPSTYSPEISEIVKQPDLTAPDKNKWDSLDEARNKMEKHQSGGTEF